MTKQKYLLLALALVGSLAIVGSASAQMMGPGHGRGDIPSIRPGIVGTVTAINGTTITVISTHENWGPGDKESQTSTPDLAPAPVIYTVDGSHAAVIKGDVTSTISAIAVGDMVMVQGTITGTNVVATTIRDNGIKAPEGSPRPKPTPLITGNGQPVIAGKVSAISGTTLTIATQSNITYTVDASTAKIEKSNALTTLASVAVGDNVVVQGSVNGTSVTAYSVIDQSGPMNVPGNPGPKPHPGFFGGIGKFFQHLFGF